MSLDKENEMENKSPLEKNKTYEILFIGNSYTYYNSTVPEEFRKIALSAGYTVNVDSVTKARILNCITKTALIRQLLERT